MAEAPQTYRRCADGNLSHDVAALHALVVVCDVVEPLSHAGGLTVSDMSVGELSQRIRWSLVEFDLDAERAAVCLREATYKGTLMSAVAGAKRFTIPIEGLT